ncbi:LPXTG cell wall anchor domain-containing protein [Companilactobacillus crustorum]|uniref:Gram-positive cocci surface proteins LPxTG domain-containing protein n=1 Tax=Companilactobacillus formosensis TaxID=1617889 RepID=A0A2P4R6J9_9LACO|nr:LPXTG cell wall anchor domain-containing protein [Companilactobacillus crustorum]
MDPENPTEPNESIDPNETTDPSETSKPELNLNENIKDNNDGIDDLEWNTSKENDRINTINNNVTSEVTAPEKNFENLITNNQLSKLPQTGNQKTSWLSYLGIALMMFIPAFLKKH